MENETSSKSKILSQFKNVETLADQTAVHRKKFEFALSLFRKIVSSIEKMESTDFETSERAYEAVFPFFHEILQILSENLIQTWTIPTIENPPCFVFEQLTELFTNIKNALQKCGMSGDYIPENEEWIQYNILDLSAISASFTQYLKTPGIKDSIFTKVTNRLESINEYLAENSTESLAPRVFSPIPVHYQSWKVDYSDFIEDMEIGHGVSAHVYRGIDKRNNEEVAIKKFTFKKLNSSRFQSYQREVAVLATAQHPALLRLIGATDRTPFCIITEWMNGGTLYNAIHKPGFLSPTERTIAAFDIARGMEFLHSRKIVHRDLKTLNVLMKDDKKCKICDFGFSRFAENDTLMSSSIGTPHWMAPEILKKGSFYTSKVDVYAYGIVLWELATSETPYYGKEPSYIIHEVLFNDVRPTLPLDINPQMKDMITLCWARDPDARPPFDEIVEAFKKDGLMFDGADPDEVNRYIASNATEGEQLSTKLVNVFKEFMEGKGSIKNVLSTLEITGLPHNIIEAAWTSIKKYIPSVEEAVDYINVLSYFIKTSKLGQVSEILRKMPSGIIPQDVITKFVSEIPTGSKETDRNICIAACKNKAADLCSLYSTSPEDVALSLEVCAAKGVEKQLHVIVVDRCVQSISTDNKSLLAASLRCLIALNEAKRIPHQVIVKCFQIGEPFVSLSFAACAALGEAGNRIDDVILTNIFCEIERDARAALLFVAACKNLEAADFIINQINNSGKTEGTETIARILLSAYCHVELRPKIRSCANNFHFDDKINPLSVIGN